MEFTIAQILLMQYTIMDVRRRHTGIDNLRSSLSRSIQRYLFFCSQRYNFPRTD